MRHPTEPSDKSFRALEHPLGLNSTNANTIMTIITAQVSPKSNHESFSVTIVASTKLINQKTTSLHLSYAPIVRAGNFSSSQNVPLMLTIKSITDPGMNLTTPAPLLVDNSDIEEPYYLPEQSLIKKQ